MSHSSDHELVELPPRIRDGELPLGPGSEHERPGDDLWLGGLAVGVGAAVAAYSATLPRLGDGAPGPGLFPAIAGAAMALAGLVLLARGVRAVRSGNTPDPAQSAGDQPDPAREERITPGAWVRIGVVAGAIAFYVLVVQHLGFPVTMAALIFAITKALGGSWLKAGLTALVTAVLLLMFFEKLLLVQLPDGVLG